MSYKTWPIFVVIMLFPVLSLALHNAGNICLFLLLIFSIVAAVTRFKPMQLSFAQVVKDYWPFHLAMVSQVIAVVLNQISSGDFAFKYYDSALRIALFVPVFWILMAVPLDYIKKIQWAFLAGAFIALGKVYYLTQGGSIRPPNMGFLATIPFSAMALIFSAVIVVSIGWTERQAKWINGLKIAAGLAGIYVTVLTQTRGSWVAIPFFITGVFFFAQSIRWRYRLIIGILALAGLVLAGTYSSVVEDRVAAAKSDIALYVNGENEDTSVGVRLQLWEASWKLFAAHPVFGVGRENFKRELGALSERKVITPLTASFSHSHNEILFNMAILGVFGLLGILAIYFVPAYYFARELRHSDRALRAAAGMGLSVCMGFFLMGLTDMMFFWNVTGGIYSMSLATFLVCVVKRKKELERIVS
ncbi:O-antigen ligase family protein [Glaciimonas immobilis]|uniref:O-antigen ligase n=1 Tax=Glaciimonas immobilis TaxID=728004 RepID=A0A840RVI5_9BURK|nr:O-antigen ligase family protein [Glaciimonas immobilis]KAF3999957.1 O-antigen ligase family protein [Glaciimonas immobilis]MBB5200459.1 O-antigen ligase [Glaciimonas immobilis]